MTTHVYAGVSAGTGGTISGLFRRDIQTSTWTHAAEGMLDVHAICVSPTAPETPLFSPRMGLLRVENKGATWQSFDLPEGTGAAGALARG